MKEIDGKRLDEILRDKGLVKAYVSRDMKYGSSFISDCIHRNKMNERSVMLLEQLYGIKFEDYKKNTEVKKETQAPSDKAVARLIYKAVYYAGKHAWEDKEVNFDWLQ